MHNNRSAISWLHIPLAQACAALALTTSVLASGVDSQKKLLEQSTISIEQLVQHAHDGKLTPEQLRIQRTQVERTLEVNLGNSAIAVRAKEQKVVYQARTDLNQQVMRSQEFEFFGPHDRPEWGWYPSRHIQSTGSAVKVDNAGKATLTPAKK